MIAWISEREALPPVAQQVLLATPRQTSEFWDLAVARLLVRHEGVVPLPVEPGARWPTDYYWQRGQFGRDHSLVTGNGWWALLDQIPLPPGAAHRNINGFHCLIQTAACFIPQGER